MKHSRWLRTLCVVGIIIAIWAIASLFLKYHSDKLFRWIRVPVEIQLTESRRSDILEKTGFQCNSTESHVEGYLFSGQESSYVFIWELPCENAQNADSQLRNTFQLDSNQYSGTMLAENNTSNLFISEREYLEKRGIFFTHVIKFTNNVFAEIYYCVKGDVLIVALIYSNI